MVWFIQAILVTRTRRAKRAPLSNSFGVRQRKLAAQRRWPVALQQCLRVVAVYRRSFVLAVSGAMQCGLTERQAAIDMNHLAGDMARFVRQQKRDQRGDVRGFGDVAERR